MSTCHHWGNDAEDLKTEAYHFNVDVLAMTPQEGANDLTEVRAGELSVCISFLEVQDT